MEILIPVTTLACGLPMFFFLGGFQPQGDGCDSIICYNNWWDALSCPSRWINLSFLSLFPPRFVLSRGRWGSGEVAEERPAAHQWPRELHRFPYATPRRTRYDAFLLLLLFLLPLYLHLKSTRMVSKEVRWCVLRPTKPYMYIIHTTQCIWAIFRASVYLQNRECVSRSW